MLETILKKNQKWIFASLLLLFFGFYFFPVFDANQIILSVAPENTPPTRFDVTFGTFKINQKIPDSLKSIDYNDCCVDASNEDDFFEGGDFASDNIYIVTFDSIGLKKSGSTYYPLLKVNSHIKINSLVIAFYLILLLIVIINTGYVIRKFIKE